VPVAVSSDLFPVGQGLITCVIIMSTSTYPKQWHLVSFKDASRS